MNTATISPALDMLANKPANAQASKTPEADNDSPRFADVLSQQHASQAPETGQPVDKESAAKDSHGQAHAQPEADQLARLAAQSGVAGQPLALNAADPALILNAATRGDARQLRDAGLATAQTRQVRPADAKADTKADTKVDVDHALLRAGSAPVGPNASSATLAALMNPAAVTSPVDRRVPPDTAGLHQTVIAGAKPKTTASMPGSAVLSTDIAKTVDLAAGKIAVNEFSTAMIDAANLARVRLSAHNAPSDGIAMPAVNDQAANLARQIMPSGPASSTLNTLSVAVPVNNPQWGTDFGRQFVSMLQNGANGPQIAELRLDPPELGPLRITLNLSDNVAHAAFFSPHASVRQTVENALPQLQELLAQAGISLGDTSVNDQSQTAQNFSDSNSQKHASGSARTADTSLLAATDHSAPATRNRLPDALVDTFA